MTLIVPDYVLPLPRARFADFFLLFARFEFALKVGGFAVAGRYGAEVNWKSFSEAGADSVFQEQAKDIQVAVAYLEGMPPKQETYFNGSFGWKARTAPTSYSRMRALLFYMQGARNNLIHGAKFLEKESQDPDRARKLLEAAEVLITYFVLRNHPVSEAFHG